MGIGEADTFQLDGWSDRFHHESLPMTAEMFLVDHRADQAAKEDLHGVARRSSAVISFATAAVSRAVYKGAISKLAPTQAAKRIAAPASMAIKAPDFVL